MEARQLSLYGVIAITDTELLQCCILVLPRELAFVFWLILPTFSQ
jgi:hypothetical protein